MDNKKKVFLHIGHGKTGSTAFQCFMAKNYLNLIENNILYNKSELIEFNLALENKINSGNINPKDDWVRDSLLPVLKSKPNYKSYIFSNENLFHNLRPFFKYLNENLHIEKYEFEMILAVRNPSEMLLSEYNQNVKREGMDITYEQFLEEKNYVCTHTMKARNIVKNFEDYNIKYHLFNYSTIRYEIIESIAKILGIYRFCRFNNSNYQLINRSLTNDELTMVRFFNKFYGKNYGTLISDRIVNEIKKENLKKESLEIIKNHEFKLKIRESNEKNINFLNKKLDNLNQLNCNLNNYYSNESINFDLYQKIFEEVLNFNER